MLTRSGLKITCTLALLLAGLPAQAQVLPQNIAGATGSTPGFPVALQSRPIPIRPNRLKNLSSDFANQQYQTYLNTVRAYNRIKKDYPNGSRSSLEGQLFNRQFLLYRSLEFLGISSVPTEQSTFIKILSNQNLNFEIWQKQLYQQTEHLKGGTGWLIWEYNLLSRQTGFYPAFDDTDVRLGSIPIIVIDLHRTSYQRDFERDIPAYIKAIFDNLNWLAIDQQLNQLGL